MHEIRFRAWLESEKKMFYVLQLEWDTDSPSKWHAIHLYPIRIIQAHRFEEVGLVLEQFTGLLDKNGKEIYEGDWIDVKMSYEGGTLPHRGIIVYDNTFGAFGTKNDAGVTLLHNHCLHTLEVIGTIHDKET